MIIGYPGN